MEKLKKWLLVEEATMKILDQNDCVFALSLATHGQKVLSRSRYREYKQEQYNAYIEKNQLKLF